MQHTERVSLNVPARRPLENGLAFLLMLFDKGLTRARPFANGTSFHMAFNIHVGQATIGHCSLQYSCPSKTGDSGRRVPPYMPCCTSVAAREKRACSPSPQPSIAQNQATNSSTCIVRSEDRTGPPVRGPGTGWRAGWERQGRGVNAVRTSRAGPSNSVTSVRG